MEKSSNNFVAEQLVKAYAGPSCIVRPRAVFGPGDTVVFPRILRAAASGRAIASAGPRGRGCR